MVYATKTKLFTLSIIVVVFFYDWKNCLSQGVQLFYTFPQSYWNQSAVIGNGTHLLGSVFSSLPQSVFSNEHTGFENTVNSLYRTTLLAGIILPISSIISNGNSAVSNYLHYSNAYFTVSNPFQFWNNTVVASSPTFLNSTTKIEQNFHRSNGFNQSIFLRNALSKNILHTKKSSIVESAVMVSTAIAQLRPFIQQQTFSGSSEYGLSDRFQHVDTSKATQQRKNFQSISTINLLNPLIWTSLYHSIFSYPFKGKSAQQSPFIRITKTVTYLPYFDVLLAPYGPEVRMTNVFSNQNQLQTVLTFRFSSTENDNPFSVAIEVTDYIIKKDFYTSGCIEFWNQPKDFVDSPGKIGGQVLVDFTYDVNYSDENMGLGICGGIGYKSYGFSSIPTLQESFFIQAGISLRNLP